MNSLAGREHERRECAINACEGVLNSRHLLLPPAMQCTLLIPHLFWPGEAAAATTAGLTLSHLQKLLARAQCERHPGLPTEAWLCEAFEVERQQDWPIAALTLAFDGGEPGTDYWLRADPIHLK